mmetsp:Transcript_124509/g.226536  ORF Transcript_124509/g.226536 Transcript_124509/m.226536 type:complete len:207 (+) Transcript_124509:113-733(+)
MRRWTWRLHTPRTPRCRLRQKTITHRMALPCKLQHLLENLRTKSRMMSVPTSSARRNWSKMHSSTLKSRSHRCRSFQLNQLAVNFKCPRLQILKALCRFQLNHSWATRHHVTRIPCWRVELRTQKCSRRERHGSSGRRVPSPPEVQRMERHLEKHPTFQTWVKLERGFPTRSSCAHHLRMHHGERHLWALRRQKLHQVKLPLKQSS